MPGTANWTKIASKMATRRDDVVEVLEKWFCRNSNISIGMLKHIYAITPLLSKITWKRGSAHHKFR